MRAIGREVESDPGRSLRYWGSDGVGLGTLPSMDAVDHAADVSAVGPLSNTTVVPSGEKCSIEPVVVVATEQDRQLLAAGQVTQVQVLPPATVAVASFGSQFQ